LVSSPTLFCGTEVAESSLRIELFKCKASEVGGLHDAVFFCIVLRDGRAGKSVSQFTLDTEVAGDNIRRELFKFLASEVGGLCDSARKSVSLVSGIGLPGDIAKGSSRDSSILV
jgi:hypothetical protein